MANAPEFNPAAIVQRLCDTFASLRLNCVDTVRLSCEAFPPAIPRATRGIRNASAPDSRVIFDVVEGRLGLRRVNAFKYRTGHDELNPRRLAEWRAEGFRKSHSKEMRSRFYLEHAWAVLRDKSRWGLMEKGFEARSYVLPMWPANLFSDDFRK